MILIALAGMGAGAINALVGSGTLITFPTLVALGYPPVTATMSNAIGLVAGSVSGTWGYRKRTARAVGSAAVADPGVADRCGDRARSCCCICRRRCSPRSCRCCSCGVGPGGDRAADSGVGPPARRGGRTVRRRIVSPRRMAALVAGTFAVGRLRRVLHRGAGHSADRGDGCAAARGGAADERGEEPAVAAGECRCGGGYTLVAFDRISWPAAGLIAVGSLIGGWLGAHYGRRLSPNALRAVIVVVGLIGLYRLLDDSERRLR